MNICACACVCVCVCVCVCMFLCVSVSASRKMAPYSKINIRPSVILAIDGWKTKTILIKHFQMSPISASNNP